MHVEKKFRLSVDSISSRIPFIFPLREFLQRKTVPKHRYTFFYLFGGISLLLLAVQMVTGMLLALYYAPHPDQAHESVKRIMAEVEFGWLVRSVHSWGANLMVAMVLVHMFSTFFMKAYRKPRELMWLSGSIIFFLVLGFAFTGYLLPWDTVAYFATQIGTEIPKSIPVMGELAVRLLRGEDDVGVEALKRMYSIHVVILPIVSICLVGFHVLLQLSLGTSSPIGVRLKNPEIPFWPSFMLRDFLTWTIVLIVLLGFAILLPAELGGKADPFASAPVGIKPEWYFLPLYQTLRMFPTEVFSLNGEMIVNVLVVSGSFFWIMIPFVDKRARAGQKDIVFPILGIALIAYSCVAIALAYLT